MADDKGLDSAKHFTPADGWTPGNLDFFTVPQAAFTDEDNAVWSILYERQKNLLRGRAIDLHLKNLEDLGIRPDRMPDIAELNVELMRRTGWQVVTVPGLIPDAPFMELMTNRRFPVGNFIRTRDQIDYIQEPDIFHDIFGHVPLLADPVFADYMQAFGEGGIKAAAAGAADKLARLYWYTVEFGMIRQPEGLRAYGAGILSSPTEVVFAVESPSPNRIGFDVPRILQTRYRIDDFQDNYFVIESFDELFEATRPDFLPLYAALENAPEHDPGVILPSDKVITQGTGEYAREAQQRRAAKRAQK